VGNSAPNFTDPTGTTQAGNPLSNLPSPQTFLNQADQYFANQRLSGSLYGSPSQSFTGPTRSATVAPSSDPGLFSTIGSLAYDYVIEPVGSGLTYAGNSIRNKADNLAGRIENVTTTGNTGILGTSLAVYGGLEAHAIRLVGGAAGGVVDVPGTTRAAIDDLRTTKRVYDQYGTATAAARQIGLLQGTEAYYGTDVLTYETVDPFAKLSEASGRFGGTAGTAAGIGSGVTRFLTPDVPAAVPRVHGNSLDYVGDTHVYAIGGPEGSYKIGQSMQGVRKSDGASIRGEAQVRALRKQTGQPFESEIRKNFLNKASALDYETRLIERFRSRFGDDTLPGNKTNR
jgi:hypothetical protein